MSEVRPRHETRLCDPDTRQFVIDVLRQLEALKKKLKELLDT